MQNNSLKLVIKILIFLISILGFIYSQNNVLETTKYEIIDSKIPKAFNDYKIVQVSDYHNITSKKLNHDLINQIKKEKPNIIVITGDLIDSSKTNLNQALEFIDRIKIVAPIYYVTGNHETWTNEYAKLKEALEEKNVKIMNNETLTINHQSSKINLIGVEDSETLDIFEMHFKQTKYNEEEYNILLSHRPELFEEYVEKGINLVLTGHAHGGQIRIFNQGLVAPNQGFLPKYTSGKYQDNKTTMIVSRGIGNSIIPIRFNNHPELVVITLNNE